MAEDPDKVEDADGASHEPRECMCCRGTGQVISNLGGEQKRVSCPWCDGTGVRVAGIDAQARWQQEQGSQETGDAEAGADESQEG